jgi:Domain of unknown function (DUF4114)/Bacterial pre-peptidase C-terminal domain/Leishmanolysin
MNNDSFLATNQSASAFTATDFSALTRSALTTDLPKTVSSYAIAAGGLFTDNGGGNFAGDLNNPFDDARIYAGGGPTINGLPTFSAFGSPIAVGPGAIVSDAVRQRWKVENLAQPVAIAVPAYVEPPIGAFDRTFDVGQLPLNGAADVARAFGDGQLPSVVHFTGGSLALPSDTVLRNLTIVVEQGDLNFNGDGHLLENVTLIVKDGRVNFGDVRAVNTAVYASDGIDLNQGARFSGKNLLVTQHGDVVFDGATATIDPKDFVKVLAQDGNIFLNAAADVRGEFWSSADFFANQASTIVGKIRAEHNITFNAPINVISDWFPRPLEAGTFTVGATGDVKVDFLFDGSARNGQLAIVNFQGMEGLEPGSQLFIQEATRRALSNSSLGHIVIDDQTTGARFNGILGTSDQGNYNSGAVLGLQTFKMNPGDRFIVMLVPNGTVQQVYENPVVEGDKRPLFSIASANPNGAFHIAQRLNVVGNSTTFVMEDGRADTGSDRDYNDLIFRMEGATGYTALIDDVIAPSNQWRYSVLGQEILSYISTNNNPDKPVLGKPVRDPILPMPLIPQTTMDQGSNNLTAPTLIGVSPTQDLLDQVSAVDPTDIYRVDSKSLLGATLQVLQGKVAISYLSPSGELLGSQTVTEGTQSLVLPAGISGEILLKIDSVGDVTGTYILPGFESKAAEPYNIQFELGSGLTASQQAIIEAAARSIEKLIRQGLPSAIVDAQIIDDIKIKLSLSKLDGVGGTLAQTRIDFMRYGTLLPAQSIMQLDGADIAELERSGQLFGVVQHELLHALGFGNLWEAKGLVNYAKTPFAQYNGANAIAAFQAQGGSTNAIPLETSGNGSADLHWNEALFQDEIMTNDLNAKGAISPVSQVTLAALEDLGYQVNREQAAVNWKIAGSTPINGAGGFSEEEKRKLAELVAAAKAQSNAGIDIPIVIPAVNLTRISPSIIANAERFNINGEYYDWQKIVIGWGDSISQFVLDRMTHESTQDKRSPQEKMKDEKYWKFIADRNTALGVVDPNIIYAGKAIYLPIWNKDYEQKTEAAKKQREEELKATEEAEKVQQDKLIKAYKESGKGGLDWFLSKPLLEFGGNAPYETSVKDLVGSLVPDDYFRFTVSRPGYVTLYLENLLADVDLYLYDAKNRLIGESARSGVTDEKIIANLAAGTYLARVHSANGVTTDYDLKVRFDGILAQTQIGNGSSSGAGRGKQPTFSDPRIEQIFVTARDQFAAEQQAKGQAQIGSLEDQKREKQRQLDTLLAQAVVEQKAKIYSQLDGVLNTTQGNIGGGAGNTRNLINGLADGAIRAVDSLVPGWLQEKLDWLGLGGLSKTAQDTLRQTINGSRNWLNGQVDFVRDQINGAVSRFIDLVKGSYTSGADISASINSAANWLQGETDRLTNSLNDKIGEFKGQILGKLDWTRNIRTPDWARNLGVPDWNLYDHAIVGLVNNLASGANSFIDGAKSFFKGSVNGVKPLVQGAVAVVVDALFGDKTGGFYNEINGINRQIDSIRNAVQKTIDDQTARFKADVNQLLGSLGLDGNKIFDTLMNFSNSPGGQIGMAVLEVILGLIPGVGQAIDIKDTAISLHEILIQGKQSAGEFIGLLGALSGWVPGVGDAIKSVAKVAVKGTDFLMPILKNFGSDFTETVIKKVDDVDWSGILTNVTDDVTRRWSDTVRILDQSAGWILNTLNVTPAIAAVSAIILSLRKGVDEALNGINSAKRSLSETLDKADNKVLLLTGPVKVSPQSVDDLLKGATKQPRTGVGNTAIYLKDYGVENLWKDYQDFTKGLQVVGKSTSQGALFVASMSDGRTIVGRGFSSGGPATIEIQKDGRKMMEIRYGKYGKDIPQQSVYPPFDYIVNSL